MKARLTGVGILIIGLTLFFLLIPMGIDSPGRVDHITLAPDFWPRIISLILAAMGILSILFPGQGPGQGESDSDETAAAAASTLSRSYRLGAVLASLFAYYFAIDWLGMVLPGMALILLLGLLAGERRPWPLIAPALCLPALLYVFFVHVANVPIPLGVFEFLRG